MYTVHFNYVAPRYSLVNYTNDKTTDNVIEFMFKIEKTEIDVSKLEHEIAKEFLLKCGLNVLEYKVEATHRITNDSCTYTLKDIYTMLDDKEFINSLRMIQDSNVKFKLHSYLNSAQFYIDTCLKANKYHVMYVYDYSGGIKKPIATLVTFENIFGCVKTVYSICNENDTFVKEMGVEAAIDNMRKNKVIYGMHRKIVTKNGATVKLIRYLNILKECQTLKYQKLLVESGQL